MPDYGSWPNPVGNSAKDVAEYYERLRAIDSAELARKLKRAVVGQDEFIDRFVPQYVAMLRRLSLVATGSAKPEDLPRLSTALIVGPTGSGKTFLSKMAARLAGIYARIVDCTTLTGAGWHGNGVDEELKAIAKIQESHPLMPIIVIWDEADKMRYGETDESSSFNPQPTFLKYLDGGIYRGSYGNDTYEVDTDLIINIFLGAFSGIEDIVRERTRTGPRCGFTSKQTDIVPRPDDLRARLTTEDVCKWGMSREFCGRIGPIETIPTLAEKDLALIVSGSENSIEKRYNAMTPKECEFRVSVAATNFLAKNAHDSGLGARALETTLLPTASRALDEAWARNGKVVLIHLCKDQIGYHVAVGSRMPDAKAMQAFSKLEIACRMTRKHRKDEGSPERKAARAIGEAFKEQRFDLAYFLASPKGLKHVAKCLATECCDDEDVPRAFEGTYKEAAAEVLLHFMIQRYSREYWQMEHLYTVACLARNREHFSSLLDERKGEDEEAGRHRMRARLIKEELDRISPEVFWEEAKHIESTLLRCGLSANAANRVASAIREAMPATSH